LLTITNSECDMDMIIHVDDCNNDYCIFCKICSSRNTKHIEEDHNKSESYCHVARKYTTIERLSTCMSSSNVVKCMFGFIHNLRNGDFCHAMFYICWKLITYFRVVWWRPLYDLSSMEYKFSNLFWKHNRP
jgi:hypothetical protein